MESIEFNLPKLEALREAYNYARENDIKVFKFEENDLLTDYAKYLIQYLDSELKPKK